MLAPGDEAPDFTLPEASGEPLAWYRISPKDTPTMLRAAVGA